MGQGALSRLRDRAAAQQQLAAAVRALLPDFIDASLVKVDLVEDGNLRLEVPAGQARLLAQLLPSLPPALTEYAVRRVSIRARP